jgi:glycosyltransferase involved in cell wall biosynthesis
MSKQPLVSIITPSFDQAEYIEATIKSILSQDYPNIEHIVVDGGSTDGTLDILEKYPHLIWTSEPDSGQSDAINKGFRKAKGEITAWLNSDDVYLPGAIKEAVSALQKHPEAGMVYSNFYEIDGKGKRIRGIKPPKFTLDEEINRGNCIPQQTVFMQMKALREVDFLNEKYHYAMDYDLWIKLWKKYPVIYEDAYWAEFRMHGTSKTVSQTERFWPEVREISRKYGGKFFSEVWVMHHSEQRPWLKVLYIKTLSVRSMIRGRRYRVLFGKLVKNLLHPRSISGK